MKITIEVEIQPDEVGLATELLSTLRSLTDHVKFVTLGSSALPASAPPAAVPPVTIQTGPSAAAAAAAMPNGTAQYQAASRGVAPPLQVPQQQPQAPAPPPAPAPPVAAVVPQMAPPAALAPAPTAPSAVTPPLLQGHPQPFVNILPRLANPATQEQASADIVASLRAAPELDKAAEELVAAYETQVFENNDVQSSSTGVMPYMTMYPRLPEDLRNKVREKMVSKVLTALTKKRPIAADRLQFFGYADAFAALVKFEAVPMEGAIQTLSRLLLKIDTRCAGVTMLGKTVEYCGDQLLRVSQAPLAGLWRALESVREEVFQYDMQYILGSLHAMSPPSSQPPAGTAPGVAVAAATTAAAAAPPAGAPAAGGAARAAPQAAGGAPGAAAAAAPALPTAISHYCCYTGHSSTVFTLCYDAIHGQLSSGGQDGQLLVWNHEGTPVSKMDVSSHFVCSLDVLPRSGTLLAAAVPNPEVPNAAAEPPCVLGFAPPAGLPRVGAWSSRGRLHGLHRGIISFVRALGGDGEVFAIGENAPGEQGAPSQDVVCLYDVSRGGPLDQTAPLSVYSEHRDMVTCAAPWNANPHVFVSGSRDATVRIWDRRVAQSVGLFGEMVPNTGQMQAHLDMVTCLDTTDNLLLSTSVDGFMCIWDFRQLTMTHGSVAGPVVKLQIDQQPTLKVAVTGAPHSRLAAISTYQGLYVMDFTNMSAPTTLEAPPFSDGRPFKYYHDIRWAGGPGAPGQPVLFCASDDPRIDLFALSF